MRPFLGCVHLFNACECVVLVARQEVLCLECKALEMDAVVDGFLPVLLHESSN